MRAKTLLLLILIAAAVLSALYYFDEPMDESSNTDVVVAELARLNIETSGVGKFVSEALPRDLNGDVDYGIIEPLCVEGGYDLESFAGQLVSIETYTTDELYVSGEDEVSLDAVVMYQGNAIVCVYKIAQEDSGLVPGVFSILESNIITR